MTAKTLCLVMIVKNESAIIKRCLDSVKDYINYWVICDTGSTDHTRKIVRSYFKKNNIPGEYLEHEWKNFGHNWTLAVQAAKGKADYLLLFEADFTLKVNDPNFREKIGECDGYTIDYEEENGLRNMLLVNGSSKARWVYSGVIYERIYADEQLKKDFDRHLDGISIHHHKDGGCRGDKFQRDVKLLLDGLKENPTNAQYWFYLGYSYYNLKEWEKSIEAYQKRIEYGGDIEDTYYAMCQVCRCKINMGKSVWEFMGDVMKAYEQEPKRLEAIYELVKHCREQKLYRIGYDIGRIVLDKMQQNNSTEIKNLTLSECAEHVAHAEHDTHALHAKYLENTAIYDWMFWDELAICAFYNGEIQESADIWLKLIQEKRFHPSKLEHIKTNYGFALKALMQKKQSTPQVSPIPLVVKSEIVEENHTRQVEQAQQPPTANKQNKIVISLDHFQLDIIKNNVVKQSNPIANEPKILILGHFLSYNLNKGVSNNRIKWFHYISQQSNNILVQSIYEKDFLTQTVNIQDLIKRNYGSSQPDHIVFYLMGTSDLRMMQAPNFINLNQTNIKKTIWIEDSFFPEYYQSFINNNRFDNILLMYDNRKITQIYQNMYPKLKVSCIEQYIDTNIFKDYCLPKKYDILFYGYHELSDIYPFRHRMYNLLRTMKDQFNILIIEHPGYNSAKTANYNNDFYVNEKLSQAINESYLTICTSNKYDLFLKKYIEVGCSGSVICGDLPEDYQDLKNEIYMIELRHEMSDEAIINIIKEALNDKKLLEDKARSNTEYFRKTYCFDEGYNKLYTIIK